MSQSYCSRLFTNVFHEKEIDRQRERDASKWTCATTVAYSIAHRLKSGWLNKNLVIVVGEIWGQKTSRSLCV